jgi:hypothetical protein
MDIICERNKLSKLAQEKTETLHIPVSVTLKKKSCFVVLMIESRALCLLGKHCSTGPHPQI